MRSIESGYPARSAMAGRRGGRSRLSACATLALVCGALGGCAMPASGPATASFTSQRSGSYRPLPVIDISPQVLGAQKLRAPLSLAAKVGTGAPRTDLRISRGDSVQVSLWEAPPGTLFSATTSTGQTAGSASTVQIPAQTVGGDGTLGIPYAGRIKAVGETPASVESKIAKALEGKAVQPQVLVTIQRSAANTVTVTGEVAGGARVPLSSSGDRVLDVIAAAGGLRAPVNESVVQLTRGGVSARALFETLVRTGSENVYLRPGDIVTVMREPRSFTALGATGRNAEIPFESSTLTMAEAVAKAGGLVDYRADASGVFLFRFEDPAVLRQLGPSDGQEPNRPLPVIYRFNLKAPETLVAMSAFRIMPKDMIYVSNAPGAELQKFMSLVQGLDYPSLTATGIAVSAR